VIRVRFFAHRTHLVSGQGFDVTSNQPDGTVTPMRHASATDPKFLGTLESWLHSLPEILVLIRYSAAAGAKDFEIFSSLEALSNRIGPLPPRTSIVAFRQPQLPLRGVVDEGFVASCLSRVPDGSEFLVLETARRAHGEKSWSHWIAGETHAELREVLEASRGVTVAVGPYPSWLADSDDVISAVVPDENGLVRGGIY
jgi:hypothetical protein